MTRAPTPASHGQRRRDAAPGRPRHRKAPARARPLLHVTRGRVRSPLLPCHGASAPAVPRSHASLSHARPREGWDVCTPPHGHPGACLARGRRSVSARQTRGEAERRVGLALNTDVSLTLPGLSCSSASTQTSAAPQKALPLTSLNPPSPLDLSHTRGQRGPSETALRLARSAAAGPPGPRSPSSLPSAADAPATVGFLQTPRGAMCLPVPRALAPAGPAARHGSPPPPPVAHSAAVTSRCAVRRSLWEAPWGSDGPRWATPPVSQWLGHAFGSRLHHRAGPAAAADGRSQGR